MSAPHQTLPDEELLPAAEPVKSPPPAVEQVSETAADQKVDTSDSPTSRTSPASAVAVSEGARSSNLARRDAIGRRLLALADICAAGLALALSISVLGDDSLRPLSLLALPLVVLVSKTTGLYDRDEIVLHRNTLDETPKLFQAATLYTLVLWLLRSVLVRGHIGTTQLLGTWIALLLGMVLARTVARLVASKTSAAERCLVIGDEVDVARIRNKLAGANLNAGVVASINPGRTAPSPTEIRRGAGVSLIEIAARIDADSIDRVIVVGHPFSPDNTVSLVSLLKARGVKVSTVPGLLEAVGSAVEVDDVNGLRFLSARPARLARSSFRLKRSVDLLGAGAGLLLCSPFFALMALLIRLDSPGGVLFPQTRIGRRGKPFILLKFRTMVDGADEMKASLAHLNESDGFFKISADPRITRMGRFLRSTSLDELPQLINVLRGEMSLVGPRPLIPEEDRQIIGLYRSRLDLMPGMTGQWQVLGSSRVPLSEMIVMDYLYIANWSLWMDVKILLRTVPHVFAGRGL